MTPALIGGRVASVEEAVAAAALLLRAARLPLVFGLVESTVEAQREAARLAEALGGVIDSAATLGRLSSLAAFAQAGLVTASLGALRQRADLVVFWGCDPEGAPPAFEPRFLGERSGRQRIAVDVGDARGPAGIDQRLALTRRQELDALVALRALVRGRRVDAAIAAPSGLPLEALRTLAARLSRCTYGVIVHDGDPPPDRRAPERAWALGMLAREASHKTCLRLFAVRSPGNAVGAENVLAWRSGFPAAVSFARGEPRYDPSGGSGEVMLRRGDVDAALVVGTEPQHFLTSEAQAQLSRTPTVRLGPELTPGTEPPAVFIATAPAAATPGSLFRMDGIAVRRTPAPAEREAARERPTEAAVLARIAAALEAPSGKARA